MGAGREPRFLPFADAATDELPLARLLRLSLFQVSVGMAMVLLNGTLNRVMIVELGVPASLVAIMVALPLVFAPLRALIGFRSDTHRSVLGWRRVPYIWFGTLLQFGGFAIMPFALLVLSGEASAARPMPARSAPRSPSCWSAPACTPPRPPAWRSPATSRRTDTRPRVVALLYVMLLVGMVVAALFVLGALLADFSQLRLIQVVQGAAVITMVLNIVALWKQEGRNPSKTDPSRAAAGLRRGLGGVLGRAARQAAAGRGGARHRRLLHAGRAAGALWRPDPASRRRRDDHADGAAGGRHHRRLRARGAQPGGRHGPLPASPRSAPLVGLPAFAC